MKPAGFAGAHGFSETGQHDEPPLAIGFLTGLRLFDYGGPTYRSWTGGSKSARLAGHLEGHHGGMTWQDGENIAACPSGERPPHPESTCGCGFWAYWKRDDAFSVWSPNRPVLAAIEGSGRITIGTRGFRCERARIAALCLLFDVETYVNEGGARWGDHPLEQAALAELEDVLAVRYPSAVICSTERMLLARFPSSPEYAGLADPPGPPESRRQNRWPGTIGNLLRGPLDTRSALAALDARAQAPARSGTLCGFCQQPTDDGAPFCGKCEVPACPVCVTCGGAAPPGRVRCLLCEANMVMRPPGQPGSTAGFYTRPNGKPRDWPGRIINC